MSDPSRDDVVLTSVPEQERAYALDHLEGARIQERKLSEKLAREHRDVRVLSPMIHDPVETSTLEVFDRLEAIVTRSDGFDHLPQVWMEEHGIRGFHLHDYATESVAHHALGMILALLRRVPEGMATTLGDEPSWDRSMLMNRHLDDVTVGVLGTGKIGSELVEILSGLGARVRGHDIAPDRDLEELDGFAYAGSLEALLEVSDVLSIHTPLDETTEGLIGPGEIDRLPKGACLVNTARGGIVDQEAVAEALEGDQLAGYAADVLPGEPNPPDLATFQGLDEVVLTPHLAAYDERTTNARYAYTARIVDALLEGDEKVLDRYRVV